MIDPRPIEKLSALSEEFKQTVHKVPIPRTSNGFKEFQTRDCNQGIQKSHQQEEEEVIETLPLSVHVKNNNLITGSFNNWPERVLINLRHLANTNIHCF